MPSTSTPYGLKPINLQGGQAFSGGAIREIAMTTNSATAIYSGDVVLLGASTAGQPTAATSTVTTSTAGVIGVCVGVRYVDPVLKQQIFAQYLPGGAVTAGYTNVFIRVCDNPDQLYQIQGSGSITLANIGKNAPLTNFGGSTTTGNSTIQLLAASIANTSTLAVRIVDVVNSGASGGYPQAPGDAYTDAIVKFNFGVHSYYQSAGTTN